MWRSLALIVSLAPVGVAKGSAEVSAGGAGDEFCAHLTGTKVAGETEWARLLGGIVGGGRPDCVKGEAGAGSLRCRWTQALQAPGSRDAFAAMGAEIRACRPETEERDDAVNHPDFYDAFAFGFGTVRVSLSIKDKSGLQATYVTFRRDGTRD